MGFKLAGNRYRPRLFVIALNQATLFTVFSLVIYICSYFGYFIDL